jgi:hypothetical protein
MNKLDQIKAQQLALGNHPYDEDLRPIPTATAANSQLKDYQTKLEVDIGKISAVPDIEEKQRLKALFLPDYMTYIDDYVSSGNNYPNDVAVQVMIWLFDTGNLAEALPLAYHLIKQNQRMPAKFDRAMTVFVCDAVYDWANEFLKKQLSANPTLMGFVNYLSNESWDLHPAVHSKMYVMLAKHYELAGEYASAVKYAQDAQVINPEGAGVKGLIQRCLGMLNKTPPTGDESGGE